RVRSASPPPTLVVRTLRSSLPVNVQGKRGVTVKFDLFDKNSPSDPAQKALVQSYLEKKFTKWMGFRTAKKTRINKTSAVARAVQGTAWEPVVRTAWFKVIQAKDRSATYPTPEQILQTLGKGKDDIEARHVITLGQLHALLATLRQWKADRAYEGG